MRSTRALILCGSLVLIAAACSGEPEVDPEEALRAARADSVMKAEEAYDATVFDTITFEDEHARLERGAVVWRSSCQKCHGADLAGGGEWVERLEIEVPSFQAPDWVYAGDVDALRHRVFVGHEGAMPNWGIVGLKYRDIDAVVGFIIGNTGGTQEE